MDSWNKSLLSKPGKKYIAYAMETRWQQFLCRQKKKIRANIKILQNTSMRGSLEIEKENLFAIGRVNAFLFEALWDFQGRTKKSKVNL